MKKRLVAVILAVSVIISGNDAYASNNWNETDNKKEKSTDVEDESKLGFYTIGNDIKDSTEYIKGWDSADEGNESCLETPAELQNGVESIRVAIESNNVESINKAYDDIKDGLKEKINNDVILASKETSQEDTLDKNLRKLAKEDTPEENWEIRVDDKKNSEYGDEYSGTAKNGNVVNDFKIENTEEGAVLTNINNGYTANVGDEHDTSVDYSEVRDLDKIDSTEADKLASVSSLLAQAEYGELASIADEGAGAVDIDEAVDNYISNLKDSIDTLSVKVDENNLGAVRSMLYAASPLAEPTPGYHYEARSEEYTHTMENSAFSVVGCTNYGWDSDCVSVAILFGANPNLTIYQKFGYHGSGSLPTTNVGSVGSVPFDSTMASLDGNEWFMYSPYDCHDGFLGREFQDLGFLHCSFYDQWAMTGGHQVWFRCSKHGGGGGFGRTSYVADWTHIHSWNVEVPNTYNVVFDPNGGDAGATAPQTAIYGTWFNLSRNGYYYSSGELYKFKCWNTNPYGTGTNYTDCQSVCNLTTVNGGTVVLYALWEHIDYNIKFVGNGATSGSTADMNNLKFGNRYVLNRNGFKREYSVTYNGVGGAPAKAVDTAKAKFNGWDDRNTFRYKGIDFNYYGFDLGFYVNKYADVRNAFGYNKYAALEHWYTYIIKNGVENRQSSPWFDIYYYMKHGGSDLNAAFGGNRLAYVSHYMNRGVYEGRTAAPYDSTKEWISDGAGVANLATRQGETVQLYADWTLGSVVLPTATRKGWEFVGWYTQPSGGTYIGRDGDTYTPQSNVMIYAQWKDVKEPDIPYAPIPNFPLDPKSTEKEIIYDWVATPVQLNVCATDDGSGMKSFKMYKNNTTDLIKDGNKVNDYLYEIKYTSTKEGIDRFRYEAYDNWNNKNTLYITTKIDYTAPKGDVDMVFNENGFNCDISNIIEEHSGVDKAWVVVSDGDGRTDVDSVVQELNLTSGSNINNGSSFNGDVNFNDSMKSKSDKIKIKVYIKDRVGNQRLLKSQIIDVFKLEAHAERVLGDKAYWACGEAGDVVFKTGQYVDSVDIVYPDEWTSLDSSLAGRVYDYQAGRSIENNERDRFIIPVYAGNKDFTIKVIAHKWGRAKEVDIPILTSSATIDELKSVLDWSW